MYCSVPVVLSIPMLSTSTWWIGALADLAGHEVRAGQFLIGTILRYCMMKIKKNNKKGNWKKTQKKEEKNKLHERAQQDASLSLDAIRAQQDAILAHQEAQKNKKKIKSVDVRWFGWFCWLCCFVAFVPVASASPSSCHLDALVPSLNGYSNTSAWDAAHGGSWFPSCFESAVVQTAVSSAEWADWGFAFTPVGFGCGEGLLMLGCLGVYSLVVSLWLGKCFLSPKKSKRRKKKGFVGFGKLRNHFDNVDKVGKLVQPYFVCFGCRWVRKKRVKRAKIRYRHKVQLKMHSRLHFWKSGKKPDSINKRLCRNRRSREILAIPRKSITQQLEEHPALPFSISPGCYFSGGAAGSDVTKRRRQEKKLLEGLQSLLSNVQDSDAESNRSASPTARPRGRSPKKETSFESRSRDASPAWQTVSRRKRNGKGKGAGDTFVPTPILKKEESTRHVSFQDDSVEGSLISQLKSLIRVLKGGKRTTSLFSSSGWLTVLFLLNKPLKGVMDGLLPFTTTRPIVMIMFLRVRVRAMLVLLGFMMLVGLKERGKLVLVIPPKMDGIGRIPNSMLTGGPMVRSVPRFCLILWNRDPNRADQWRLFLRKNENNYKLLQKCIISRVSLHSLPNRLHKVKKRM